MINLQQVNSLLKEYKLEVEDKEFRADKGIPNVFYTSVIKRRDKESVWRIYLAVHASYIENTTNEEFRDKLLIRFKGL